MRVLLDTNILIHREAGYIVRDDIGVLFHWLDRLRYDKCIHPLSVEEVSKHRDKDVVASMARKLQSYVVLKTLAPESPEIVGLRNRYDRSENDRIDTALLNELYANRVDLLITEDRRMHAKARDLNIWDRVFTIDGFLEKVTAENPGLSDYGVLSVKKEYFGNISMGDPFFESFKADYVGFGDWFNRKADEIAYVCKADDGEILAFLYLKLERESESYHDIQPPFGSKCRVKIGTFKVSLNGYKLGERFLKIIFDNALQWRVDEIYTTIFRRRTDQERLISLLEDWGFKWAGTKRSASGEEDVYVRGFAAYADRNAPSITYPFVSRAARKYMVPIYPEYHTELLPDSILRTESPLDYVEHKPNRNAIRKAYISRSIRKDMRPGDIIVFYRTASNGPAHYTAVATTIGVVESVVLGIRSFDDFKSTCQKRTVFNDEELRKFWDYKPSMRPFVVNFLYVHSLPKRPNLSTLKANAIITDAPRGFEIIDEDAFAKLLSISNADDRIIVN